MKRCLTILIAAALALSLTLIALVVLFSCLVPADDSIIRSLPDYTSKEFYTCGGFQDYTDYAKYTYDISERYFQQSSYFLPVSGENIEEILSYIDNFEEWVEIVEGEVAEHYDFDKSIVTQWDYYYILSKYPEPGKKYDNYNIYYYDAETRILYYFHSNI